MLLTLHRKYNLPDPVDIAAYKTWIDAEKPTPSQPLTVDDPAARPNLHDPPEPNQARSPNPTTAVETTIPQTDGAGASPNPPNPNPSEPTSTSTSTNTTLPPSSQAAPYPQSFNSIIELITRNQPIPGIEDIPDTVLDPSLSPPDHTPRRRKPWEKEEVKT